ncbi:MAG: serine/threonine protein kinase [Myxococcales bacterium]|nr:serine/threonine protein kinase [Myxococcales bacterium]
MSNGSPPSNADRSTIILGRYALGPLLGSGAFGSVHRGRSLVGDKPVAIKLQHLDGSAHLPRFEREAQSLARIIHPHVVRVLDFGHLDDGSAVLVMEFVEGRSLDLLVEKLGGVMPWREAVRLMIGVFDGLDAAHEASVIHRDVKPQNILVTASTPAVAKIIDFGIARATDGNSRPITMKGQVLGSLGYMAPEQLLGVEVDARSDVYAAGSVLYELLSGRPAFAGSGMKLVAAKLQNEGPSDVPRSSPAHDWPDALSAIVAKTLRRKPEERHSTAYDVSMELQSVLRPMRTTTR